MELQLAHFGTPTLVSTSAGDDVIVRLHRDFLRLTPDGRATVVDTPTVAAPAAGPFTLSDFGSKRRLAWEAGACAVKTYSRVVYWGQRYAAVIDKGSITVIDATRAGHVRLELPDLVSDGTGAIAHAGRLVIGGDRGALSIALQTLETIDAVAGSEATLELEHVYPLRRPDATVEGHVVWVTGTVTVVNVGTTQIRIPSSFGLERGTAVVLCDELWPGVFTSIEVAGSRRQLLEVELTTTLRVRIVRGKRKDPAATGEALAPTERQAELDHLLAEIARDPDNDSHRAVLVDLLQDLGAAYGTWLAQERGGDPAAASPAKRRAALGPLAHYLDQVVYRGGLPWTATLARKPPTDPAVVAAAAADVRLGMLSTLRAGKGPLAIYAELVGSPRAIGLRAVDAPDRGTLVALIEGHRDQLTQLYDVRFSKRAAFTLLADPTFDHVGEIDTVIQLAHYRSLLDRIVADEAGIFARVARALVIRERFHNDFGLLELGLARWAELPIRALTIGFLTLRRTNGVTSARIAATNLHHSIWMPWLVSGLEAIGTASIELADRDPRLAIAIGRALPAIELR